jgi:hypothetical protein
MNLSAATNTASPLVEHATGIKRVEQRNNYDCGAAALAMILGLSSPEEVERLHLGRECSTRHDDRGIIPVRLGVTNQEIEFALFKAGIPFLPYWCPEMYAKGTWLERMGDRVRVCTDAFVRAHLARGGTAMLTVLSLNEPGMQHWIVVTGGREFDPSREKKHAGIEDVTKIVSAILIGPPAKAHSG